MKKHKVYILLSSLLVFCISVAFGSNHNYTKTVKHDLHFEVSKITFVVATHELAATYEPIIFSFNRDYCRVNYVTGKVQNKALPLCKNIWLVNCQIALK